MPTATTPDGKKKKIIEKYPIGKKSKEVTKKKKKIRATGRKMKKSSARKHRVKKRRI